jgi:hypothetical protein
MLDRSGGDPEDEQGPRRVETCMGGMEESVGREVSGYVRTLRSTQ